MGELISNTFKSTEEFSCWLKKEAYDLDLSASELIRACILIGIPVIKNHPDLGSILAHKSKRTQEHCGDTGSTPWGAK